MLPNDTAFPKTGLAQNTPPLPAEVACRACGVLAVHCVSTGTPPHAFKLTCRACHAFIRWLSARTPEAQATQRAYHRQAALAAREPTAPQLTYLAHLGYSGPVSSFLSASDMITALVHGRVTP